MDIAELRPSASSACQLAEVLLVRDTATKAERVLRRYEGRNQPSGFHLVAADVDLHPSRKVLPTLRPQYAVDDRHDVGKRLSRARSGRQHEALALPGYLDRLALVAMQCQTATAGVSEIPLDSEDPGALLVEYTGRHNILHRPGGFEAGVQRQPRIGPLRPAVQLFLDVGPQPGVADFDIARSERTVVLKQALVDPEKIHRR